MLVILAESSVQLASLFRELGIFAPEYAA